MAPSKKKKAFRVIIHSCGVARGGLRVVESDVPVVCDARMLKPAWRAGNALAPFDGHSSEFIGYVRALPNYSVLMDLYVAMVRQAGSIFQKELNRNSIHVVVISHWGRQRAVAVAEDLAERLSSRSLKFKVRIKHHHLVGAEVSQSESE